jgi:hypothetical protein
VKNLKNLRKTSTIVRKKKREYFKDKINWLQTNNKRKYITDLYRGISEFKKGYQLRIGIIKDENGNLFAVPEGVLNTYLLTYLLTHSLHGAGY